MIAGLIPAAGHSRRMGRPKLALPLGGGVLLDFVIRALREGGCDPVLVVLGPHVAELCQPARDNGAEVLLLPDPTDSMRATVEAGLDWLTARCQPCDADAWILSPADHPTLDASVVRQLILASKATPEATIFIPSHEGKRGHPALIGWGHVEGIRNHPPDEGLNTYLRQHIEATRELPAGPAVVEDVDTPEDYRRLLAAQVGQAFQPDSSARERG